jgi:hypothetical protein
MSILLSPPPSSATPVDTPEWKRWFFLLQEYLKQNFPIVFTALDFTGSNLTSIATRNHNDLQNIQGGAVADYQHLTTAQVNQIGVGATVKNILTANTTVAADTSYVVVGYFDTSTFTFTLDGNLGII